MFATRILFWFLTLVLPVLMVYLGFVRMFKCKKLQSENGYTSKLSIANQQAWDAAQKLSARTYIPAGLLMIVGTIAFNMLQQAQTPKELLGYSLVPVIAQALIFVVLIIAIEIMLSKKSK